MQFACLLLCCFSAISAFSAVKNQSPLTLAEVVDLALDNDPTTKTAWWNVKRLQSAQDEIKSEFLPSLDLQSNVTRGKEYAFTNGPDTDFTKVDATLIFSMLLYDFGARDAKARSTHFALETGRWQHDHAMQKVIACALESAYQQLYAAMLYNATKASHADAIKLVEIARSLKKKGIRPLSDVLLAQNALLDLELLLEEQASSLAIFTGKLALLLGQKVELAPLPQVSELKERLSLLATKTRSDLLAKKAETEEFASQEMLERAEMLSKLKVRGEAGPAAYIQNDSQGMPYKVNLELNAPLFQGFESIHKTRQAYCSLQLSLQEQAELELEIAQEIFTEQCTFVAAEKISAIANERVNHAEAAYRAALEKYQSGYKMEFSEVFYANEALRAARTSLTQAKMDAHLAHTRLAYSLGTIAPYARSS